MEQRIRRYNPYMVETVQRALTEYTTVEAKDDIEKTIFSLIAKSQRKVE